jgi:threonine synthase
VSAEWLECIACHARYPIDQIRYGCDCGNLLSVERPKEALSALTPGQFDARLGRREPLAQSGVWRFREGVLAVSDAQIVTHPEGGTHLYQRPVLTEWAGIDNLHFKHEGENPTGSFKDRGMTVAVTQAVRLGAAAVACASTGNTSSSLAAYAAQAKQRGIVLIPAGKISLAKMAQALAYGARCLQVAGDFDVAMSLVRQVCDALGIYLVNSVNPFRIEGQKTIAWELLQDLAWDPPDWIVLPAGNLGNTSAVGKAVREAFEAGWIPRMPRIAAIQAATANPFFQSYRDGFATRPKVKAETIATAIRIGNPVSFEKAKSAILYTRGVVAQVTDDEILLAKREIDRAGLGCEPASACSLAGAKKLRSDGTIQAGERVVCVLTGHLLKDPDAVLLPAPGLDDPRSQIIEVGATLAEVKKVLEEWL